jgi:hypothetical protein
MKKNPSNQSPSRSKAQQDPNMRPENKDNLDHREGEEQLRKGDDVTHNRKEVKNERPSTNSENNRRGK